MAYEGSDFGLVGGSDEPAVVLQNAQRAINWYCEVDNAQNPKEILAMLGCPGLNPILSTITAPVRGLYVLPGSQQALMVVGANLYLVTISTVATASSIPLFAATQVGTLLTSVGPVVMRDNGILQNGLGGYCLIVDGTYCYYYLLQGTPYLNVFQGTLTNGSVTMMFPGNLPNGLIVASTPTLSAASGSIPAGTKVVYVDTIGVTLTMSAASTGTTVGVPVTFTAALAVNQTTATLTAAWTGSSGVKSLILSNGTSVAATFTNGSTSVTFPALKQAATAMATVSSGNQSESITLTIPVFGQITDPGFLSADRIAFIEGFLVFNRPGSRTFYCTGPGPYSVLFPGLFFALKDSSTDNLVTLYEENRELWLIGERTSEVWYNAGGSGTSGNSSFPFARIPGVGPQVGCSSVHSIARCGSQIAWLAANEQGQNIVVASSQYTWERLSTHGVEHAISQYTVVSDAIGYGYEEEGHLFYMLTFPTADQTWCYDFTSKLWHQRLSYDPNIGIWHRHRSNCFMNFSDVRIVGDYQTGQLHQMSRAIFTDAGNPLRAVRRSPHIWKKADRERLFFSQLQVEFTPGVGAQGYSGFEPGQLRGPGVGVNIPAQGGAYGTLLLLHFDGSTGSTTTNDSSLYGSSVAINSTTGAGLSTTAPKFGTAGFNTGTASTYLSHNAAVPISGALDIFATNNWTIEFWFRINAPGDGATPRVLLEYGESYNGGGGLYPNHGIQIDVYPSGDGLTGQIRLLDQGAFGGVASRILSGGAMVVGTWYHVAVVQTAAGAILYYNGAQVSVVSGPISTWIPANYVGVTTQPTIDIGGSGGYVGPQINTTIDEFRVSKSAIYTGNFTPPTQAFTNPTPGSTGVGPAGVNPQVMLRWSNDGGFTWSNEKWASIGKAGATRNRAIWRQLGHARDRVWEISITDAVPRDVIGATLFAESSM